MRRPLLVLSLTTALALSACAGEAEVDVDTTPTPTVTETVTETATEETTVASPTPVPTTTDDGTDTASPDEGGDDVAGLAFTECEAERYTVGYPADWNTNEPDDLSGPCTIFHPGGIETPDEPRGRDLHWAVSMYVDDVEFEDVRDSDTEMQEELDRRELTVDGRDALLRETRSTDDAFVPEGERSYIYTIDLDGQILVAVTYSVGDTDYERDKAILDRMVTEELSITG